MAVIRPFHALRPAPEVVQQVASVPYDVVNTKEARALAESYPLSLLNVTRSEIHFPDNTNPYSDEIYNSAKENLDRIKSAAPLIVDEEASFYFYRLIMNGRAQTGIAATFSVDDYDSNVIMKHEKTRKEKEDDRTKHIITTGAQTGPVFLTYRGVDAVNKAVAEVMASQAPLYDFTSVDGIQHTIWKAPVSLNTLIISELAAIDKLYIADGHHRAASAMRARNAAKDLNPAHNGTEEYNYFIAVLFPADELAILPYYRVVKDLNGNSKEEFLNAVSEKFTITESGEKEPATAQVYCMYLDGKWYTLKPTDAVLASNSLSSSVGEKLDVSVLQDFLLNPVLGIDDPRTNKRVDFVGGIRGVGELEKLVNSGDFAVAFSLFPVTLNDLMNISDAGEVMPPKSTWFEPKLRDGLLVHTI
ncbi:MAG: DUF1015 domain-containing protein [Ignavibacteriales bacterium]|nr:DUF1015 domain-containing protein [Ignavibacteriales bacterium]